MRKKKAAVKFRNRLIGLISLLICFYALLTGCSSDAADLPGRTEEQEEITSELRREKISSELSYERSLELQYADRFAADYYEGGYALISIADGRRYLVVPEGKKAPGDLEGQIVILEQPLEHIYLAATAVMDMFCRLDALDALRFSSQKADGWSIPRAREEMEKGNILYAGKYSMPDYEQIVSEGCSLAIENNMVTHSPEVVEKLESFGIPVWIDLSSYENHPMGRAEWIRLYGILLGREQEAQAFFEEQAAVMEQAARSKPSGKTAAFFFITANGTVNVRAGSDYVPKMIELAGGKYIFDHLGNEDGRRSTVALQMEEFYQTAKDADYLIYNSTIDGELSTLEELLDKESLLGDFKAVQEGNVWCTTRDLYQQSMSIGQMIGDFHAMFSGDEDRQEEMKFLYPLY